MAGNVNPAGQRVTRSTRGDRPRRTHVFETKPLIGLRDGWHKSVPIMTSLEVERGTVEHTSFGARMHPSDWMRLRNNGRTPLWTRHMTGVIEAERDRRRHGR